MSFLNSLTGICQILWLSCGLVSFPMRGVEALLCGLPMTGLAVSGVGKKPFSPWSAGELCSSSHLRSRPGHAPRSPEISLRVVPTWLRIKTGEVLPFLRKNLPVYCQLYSLPTRYLPRDLQATHSQVHRCHTTSTARWANITTHP